MPHAFVRRNHAMTTPAKSILLTGATGYVGGRLLPLLKAEGYHVRCLTRHPERLAAYTGEQIEAVQGDVLEPESLARDFQGIDTAFYLIHFLGAAADFEETEARAARNFGQAARQAGVNRIVYLGGLGNPEDDLSKHLRSRQATGEHLRESGVPVIELRASIIIGSGSASFEMIRSLVRKLPVMVCPRWVRTRAQPIAVEDVLSYLMESIELPGDDSRIYEIGGPDQKSYGDIMQEYARQRGLKRLMIPVPLLTPYLSSLWLGLVTPLYARIGRKLIAGMRNETVVRDDAAQQDFAVRPRPLRDAIDRALTYEDAEFAATRWSDALSSAGPIKHWGGQEFGSRLVDSRTATVDAPPAVAFEPIRKIGGRVGWYYGDWLWRLRGFMDLVVGGVGVRRGRRDPNHLRVGDALDFWRVEAYEPDRRLRLRAEMKVPGRAWLEFEVEPVEGGSEIRQTAIFDPYGALGLAYWYSVYPLHGLVFGGMLRGITEAAEEKPRKEHAGPVTTP